MELKRKALELRRESVKSDLIIETGPRGKNAKVIGNVSLQQGLEWTETSVRAVSLGLVDSIIRQQVALDNPPDAIYYDDSLFIPPEEQNRSITVIFDTGVNVRDVMNKLEAEVAARIPNTVWTWNAVSATPANRKILQSQISGSGPVRLAFGDALFYTPFGTIGGVDDVYGNILYMRGLKKNAKGRKNRTPKVGRSVGWFGQVSRATRRYAKPKGVYVKAMLSEKPSIAFPTRILPPGKKLGKDPSGNISAYSGRPLYYQGVWGFRLKLTYGSTRGRSGRAARRALGVS